MKDYSPNSTQKPIYDTSAFAAILTDDDLDAEVKRRRKKLMFPLEVFPARISLFINCLLKEMHGERAFVGLTLLQASSSAIGSALRAIMGDWEVCLAMWGCSVGISSSGKSMIQGVLLKPLNIIQDDYNREYRDLCEKEPQKVHVQKVLIYQDITLEALVRDVMSANYKGVTRYEDELLKWLDDMDRYRSGKSEQTFWTGSWSPSGSFSQRRTGGKMTFIDKKHFVASVIGSTQPGVLYRFYEKDRLETGYIFRMLWAFPETDKVISPNLSFKMPPEIIAPYNDMLNRLYRELKMSSADMEPQLARVNTLGINIFQDWQDRHTKAINLMDNIADKNVKAGIFGKIKEYALRFACILKAMETACDKSRNMCISTVEDKYIVNGLKVAEYFLNSGYEAYQTAKNKIIVPPEVIEFAAQYKMHNCNMTQLAVYLNISRQAVHQRYHKYVEKYPGAFGAINR